MIFYQLHFKKGCNHIIYNKRQDNEKRSEIPQNTFKRVQYAHTNLILTKINTFNQDKMQWHYIKTV
jgi:hypothetical protein